MSRTSQSLTVREGSFQLRLESWHLNKNRDGDISDAGHYRVNHRNLFLASSAKPDEMSGQESYRSAFPKVFCITPGFSKISVTAPLVTIY